MTSIFDLGDVSPTLAPEPTSTPSLSGHSTDTAKEERLLLSVVEAAQRLGIGRSLMYELLGSGQIRSIHIGRLHKVPVAALFEFVARRSLT
jgi:excisionase family DNA binding protein